MKIDKLCLRPLKLKPARVGRNYTGGLLLEQWQNQQEPKDGHMPESWVASTVDARTDNYVENEGLSLVDIDSEKEIYLRDIINHNPEGFLGIGHVNDFSTDMGILVKLIDSCSRLYLQVHPDKEFAKKVFDSDFGKTEAWYILGGRKIADEEPYVLLGFKEGVTEEKWRELFEKQDIEGMVNSLHRFTVKPGDVYFIKSGIPHALGPGCFVLEVQEPTDFTFRVERTTPDDRKLPDTFCHQGVGFDNMLKAFHYDTYTKDEILEHVYLKPELIEKQDGGIRRSIIPSKYSDYFTMHELLVNHRFYLKKPTDFMVGVVISGHGRLLWDGGEMKIGQADELFFPAALKDMILHCDSNEDLKVVICYPPKLRSNRFWEKIAK